MRFDAFFRVLGRRLREARQRAGRSLVDVAREAAVSRRYLTDAEAGRANPSVAVLLRIASALGIALSELVDIPLRGGSGERVALVGLRGAGKSSVGRRLASELEAPFVELDRRVESLAGLSLSELFDLHGPSHFHRLEAEALEQVLSEGERVVIAAGGSIVASPASFQRLLDTCRTVWLRAAPAEHFQRVLAQGDPRPMRDRPRAMEELALILAAREPLYARCEHAVDTSDKDVEGVVDLVLARLERG